MSVDICVVSHGIIILCNLHAVEIQNGKLFGILQSLINLFSVEIGKLYIFLPP